MILCIIMYYRCSKISVFLMKLSLLYLLNILFYTSYLSTYLHIAKDLRM